MFYCTLHLTFMYDTSFFRISQTENYFTTNWKEHSPSSACRFSIYRQRRLHSNTGNQHTYSVCLLSSAIALGSDTKRSFSLSPFLSSFSCQHIALSSYQPQANTILPWRKQCPDGGGIYNNPSLTLTVKVSLVCIAPAVIANRQWVLDKSWCADWSTWLVLYQTLCDDISMICIFGVLRIINLLLYAAQFIDSDSWCLK